MVRITINGINNKRRLLRKQIARLVRLLSHEPAGRVALSQRRRHHVLDGLVCLGDEVGGFWARQRARSFPSPSGAWVRSSLQFFFDPDSAVVGRAEVIISPAFSAREMRKSWTSCRSRLDMPGWLLLWSWGGGCEGRGRALFDELGLVYGASMLSWHFFPIAALGREGRPRVWASAAASQPPRHVHGVWVVHEEIERIRQE